MIDVRVKEQVNKHGYMSGIDRMSDRVKDTHEIFTPTDTVLEMIESIGIENFAPGKTVLDPACGDGQFLVAAKWVKVYHFGMTEQEAVEDIYGVDLMRDNVDLCKERLGGGNIIMGNTLNPCVKIDEQTDEERQLMTEWFSSTKSLLSFIG